MVHSDLQITYEEGIQGMQLLIKENKVLLIIIAVAVLISFVTIGGRFSAENRNKTYDIVLDYNEIKAMADQSEHDISWWLREFRKMGIDKVGLAEESMVSLIEDTDLPVNATVMELIMKDADWQDNYPEDFIRELTNHGFDKYDVLIEAASAEIFNFVANGVRERYQPENFFIKETGDGGYIVLDGTAKQTLYSEKYKYMSSVKKGFVEKDEIVSSKLMYINYGLLPSKIEIVEAAGMDIIPRTASYAGWNDAKYAEAVLNSYGKLDKVPEYMIVGGEGIIGYDDGINTARDYIADNHVTIGLIENTTQLQNILQFGVNDIVKSTGYDAVRIFSVWDYIQNRYQYYGYEGAKEIENTLFRAVVERNVRLIYFKPIKEFKDQHVYVTELDEYKTMFSNLETRLAEHNIEYGSKASVMDQYNVSLWAKLAMALGCVAAAVLLIRSILPINRRLKVGLLTLGALGAAGAYFVMPGYAELITSFAAAVIFPSVATLFIVKQSKHLADTLNRTERLPKIIGLGILTLVIGVVISLIGGLMTAAPISSVNYMMEIDIFRGVKLAQLLPLVFFIAVYLAYYGFGDSKRYPGKLEYQDLREMMNASIKVWMVLLGVVLLGVGYYYIERTGHDSSIQVSSLEMIFRNVLEDNLIARPRSKEFLFAFPAVMMMAYTSTRRFKLWPILFGLASVIGMTSVTNTFMHIRTPLYLGFARTGYSLLFGIVIGIVGILIFELGHMLYKKLERQIG
ncbi:MAG: DUF5693 family protein [Eubacteriales bacterium]|nr:DUF5693 family protein [Eubacteriales bacterium]